MAAPRSILSVLPSSWVNWPASRVLPAASAVVAPLWVVTFASSNAPLASSISVPLLSILPLPSALTLAAISVPSVIVVAPE
ncbi:hypothetical protein CPY13_20410 [Salmonella enterica subsp. enterica serovar Typhimurium]|nr:hypothetical protein [Salmonella enterica subsp. enterica serovar Typhimurium]